MNLNIKDFARNKFTEQKFGPLLEKCKQVRETKVNEFIRLLENQVKEAMAKGQIKVVRRGTTLQVCEKDKIIRHFTAMGFDIDYVEYNKKGMTLSCKFTVQWQHLIK